MLHKSYIMRLVRAYQVLPSALRSVNRRPVQGLVQKQTERDRVNK